MKYFSIAQITKCMFVESKENQTMRSYSYANLKVQVSLARKPRERFIKVKKSENPDWSH